ncbi:uncharacterized protein G2W53_004457 [Senna tora]|uniref:Uncharacterized protein n=1 Tax=Senna tora TaxID=362788 RepID=A0A835CHA1_9FABA|nr:uncharacterized protein G2W53_004457 [Senna tora]
MEYRNLSGFNSSNIMNMANREDFMKLLCPFIRTLELAKVVELDSFVLESDCGELV